MPHLPDNVTINPDSHSTSLDEFHAICVTVVDDDGYESQVICWRGIIHIQSASTACVWLSANRSKILLNT